MATFKVKEGLYSVGILNPNMRIFDIVMSTEYGTSYNSYIVKGKDKTALVEVCHAEFFESYLENIKEVCNPEDINYIVLNHCEPDHSGALADLLNVCPNAEIVVSNAGNLYLKNITNRTDYKTIIAKDGDVIDLGGKTLKFINAPFLHWPDSMFTYCQEDSVLFSCDMFGSHYCEPYTLDSRIAYPNGYEDAFLGYYNAIFSPFKKFVLMGIGKLKGLEIDTICASHGPVLTKGNRLEYAMEKYAEWSQPVSNSVTTIPIFYCSAYGCTEKSAYAIADGIKSVIPDACVEVLDINANDNAVLVSKINTCDGFAVGSPTLNADAVAPVSNLLNCVDAINCKKKPALAFGSYGWSGEAVPNLNAKLNTLKLNVFEGGYKFQFVPSETDLKNAFEVGQKFAEMFK
jgi:flavorubredoxin